MSEWIARQADAVRFDVRLTPGAGTNGFQGTGRDADGKEFLKARVTAVAEKGKANAALIALVSKSLKVAKGDVRIVSGPTSRVKTLEIGGDPQEIAGRLAMLFEAEA